MVLVPASVFTEERWGYKWPWREVTWSCWLWGWVRQPSHNFPLLVEESLSCREMLTSVFWDSNLLPRKARRAQWLLCGLRLWRQCCSSSFLSSWTKQPHGLETGSLVYFIGVEEANQAAAVVRGLCFQNQRHWAWRPAWGTHYMKISGDYGLQRPTLSSVTQDLNSPQWFQGKNNWPLLISWTSNTSLETLWFPHANDQ